MDYYDQVKLPIDVKRLVNSLDDGSMHYATINGIHYAINQGVQYAINSIRAAIVLHLSTAEELRAAAGNPAMDVLLLNHYIRATKELAEFLVEFPAYPKNTTLKAVSDELDKLELQHGASTQPFSVVQRRIDELRESWQAARDLEDEQGNNDERGDSPVDSGHTGFVPAVARPPAPFEPVHRDDVHHQFGHVPQLQQRISPRSTGIYATFAEKYRGSTRHIKQAFHHAALNLKAKKRGLRGHAA